MIKILFQILKEFGIPFTVASIWTAYNFYNDPKKDITSLVNIFGGSFFIFSWATGQFFRIKKQQKVDSDLSKLEKNLLRIINDLKSATYHLIGNLNGGESFCVMTGAFIANPSDLIGQGPAYSLVQNYGIYAMHDLSACVTDIDKLLDEEIENAHDRISRVDYNIGMLLTTQATSIPLHFSPYKNSDKRTINVFYTSKSGTLFQALRYIKVDNEWLYATQVKRGTQILFTYISENFPKHELEVQRFAFS